MHKFPKIQSWKHVGKYVVSRAGLVEGAAFREVRYRGTVKLHGTNCGVVCRPEGLTPQSRNRVLTADADNYGFAAFVREHEAEIRRVERSLRDGSDAPMVIFGELVGSGIQPGVAITKLGRRQWVVFAAALVEDDGLRFIQDRPGIDAADLDAAIGSVLDADDLLYELVVDLSDPTSCATAYNRSAEIVTQIDRQCPWAARWELDGSGEGVVWVPVGEHHNDVNLWWKHKGGSHQNAPRVIKTVDVEAVARVEAVADTCLAGRLEQALEYLDEMMLPRDTTSIPEFLKRVGGEVKAECALELEEAGLDWKTISKTVNRRAVTWFKAQL